MENHDPVNHPSHYTDGKYEVIDFIEDKNLGFHLGNAVKYICRAGKKDSDKEVEDLQKAIWYLDRFVKNSKSKGLGNRGPILNEIFVSDFLKDKDLSYHKSLAIIDILDLRLYEAIVELTAECQEIESLRLYCHVDYKHDGEEA